MAVARALDVLISGCCLVVFAPLFLLCWWLIRREDGGPAIFRQERVGKGGKVFFIYKFRTMRLDAESQGPQLSPVKERDDRLLRIGVFLRDHHLDELPQLWNVFIGDMAFVGPRPERPYYIEQIMKHDPRYELLYQVRPGVTSYATLYNGYTDTMEKMLRRLELDLYYLEHRSLSLNLKILWLTFFRIVSGRVF
ncbi:MAG: sugar transferase [Alloprevotella sp.]|nr:sugar transferase [Alloprevotella sp.]